MKREAVGLEQDRTKLDDAQRSLAPSDDGVDTRTVSVVWTDSAVAVAIESHRIAAVAAFTLAGNQVHERISRSLLCRLGIHDEPDSSSGPGNPEPRERDFTFTGGGTASGGGFSGVWQADRAHAQGGKFVLSVKSLFRADQACDRAPAAIPDGVNCSVSSRVNRWRALGQIAGRVDPLVRSCSPPA